PDSGGAVTIMARGAAGREKAPRTARQVVGARREPLAVGERRTGDRPPADSLLQGEVDRLLDQALPVGEGRVFGVEQLVAHVGEFGIRAIRSTGGVPDRTALSTAEVEVRIGILPRDEGR